MLLILGLALVLSGIPALILYIRHKQSVLSQPSLYIVFELMGMIFFGIVLIIKALGHR